MPGQPTGGALLRTPMACEEYLALGETKHHECYDGLCVPPNRTQADSVDPGRFPRRRLAKGTAKSEERPFAIAYPGRVAGAEFPSVGLLVRQLEENAAKCQELA
jgi:hypothetical protein